MDFIEKKRNSEGKNVTKSENEKKDENTLKQSPSMASVATVDSGVGTISSAPSRESLYSLIPGGSCEIDNEKSRQTDYIIQILFHTFMALWFSATKTAKENEISVESNSRVGSDSSQSPIPTSNSNAIQLSADQSVLIPNNRHHSTSDALSGSSSPTGYSNHNDIVQIGDPDMHQHVDQYGYPVDPFGNPLSNVIDEQYQPHVTYNDQDVQDAEVDQIDFGGTLPNSHNDSSL